MSLDLDNLKNNWKTFKEISQSSEVHSKSQLKEILSKDSEQINQRFRRMLWIETIVSIIFIALFLFMALDSQEIVQILWFIMTGIYITIAVWLSYHLYKFPTENNIESNLGNSLEEQIRLAQHFINVYTKANIILAAPCAIIGFLVGIQLSREDSLVAYFQGMIQDRNYAKMLAITAIALIISLIITFLIKKYTHWYINKTYGKYLKEIETLKLQLEE